MGPVLRFICASFAYQRKDHELPEACRNLRWGGVMLTPPALPARIGPVEFSDLDGMVAIRCPQDFVPILQWAGGVREPGSHRWLVERRRVGPSLRRATGTGA